MLLENIDKSDAPRFLFLFIGGEGLHFLKYTVACSCVLILLYSREFNVLFLIRGVV